MLHLQKQYLNLHPAPVLQADALDLLQFLAEPSQPETPGSEDEVPGLCTVQEEQHWWLWWPSTANTMLQCLTEQC